MDFLINEIADKDSVDIWNSPAADNCAVGKALIAGKSVFFYSDPIEGKAVCFGKQNGDILNALLKKADGKIEPVLYFFNCFGADLKGKTASLDSYAEVFRSFVECGEKKLHIGIVAGSCIGGSAYLAAMCDIIIFSRENGMFCLTGPKVVRSFMGEDCKKEELGGWEVHSKNGTAAYLYSDNEELRAYIELLLSAYYKEDKPSLRPKKSLKNGILPMNNKPYDICRIIESLVDRDSFKEMYAYFAKNLVTGYARIGGINIGIFANQPLVMAGAIDCDATEKGLRFLNNCRKLRLPLLVIADVPSFMPGTVQEQNAIEEKGGRFLKEMIKLDTAKVTLILHKSFGGAYIAMNSMKLGAYKVFAWPGSSIGIMGEKMSEAVNNGSKRYDSLNLSLEDDIRIGSLSDVIMPEETRNVLIGVFSERMERRK